MLPDWFQQLGLIAWPLTACSIIMLMVSIERLCFHVVAFVNQDKHYSKLSDYLREHQFLPKASRDELVEMMLQELQSRYFNGTKMLRWLGQLVL